MSVPWGLIEPLTHRLQINHGQSVERLNERGGLDVLELAAAFLDTKPFRGLMSIGDAIDLVEKRLEDYNAKHTNS